MQAHLSGDGRLCDIEDCEHAQESRRRRRRRRFVHATVWCCVSSYIVAGAASLGWGAVALAIPLIICGFTIADALLADRTWQF
jgi:hypothetical protein